MSTKILKHRITSLGGAPVLYGISSWTTILCPPLVCKSIAEGHWPASFNIILAMDELSIKCIIYYEEVLSSLALWFTKRLSLLIMAHNDNQLYVLYSIHSFEVNFESMFIGSFSERRSALMFSVWACPHRGHALSQNLSIDIAVAKTIV
jgi:hypothetical protein